MTARFAIVVAVLGACSVDRPRIDGGPASGIHPAGILDPASADFHGRELARRGWDLDTCATCHGADFSGGAAKVACTTCHAGGPTACATCHGDGPTTGAHREHRTAQLACAECHVTPERWDAEGHVRRGGVVDPPPAEVTFGARAALTIDPADRAGPPSFAAGRCANVYCHGDVLGAAGGTQSRPQWDAPSPTGGCDHCHGAPPPRHAQSQCAACHPSGLHIDGVVQVGRTSGCDGCHGTAASSAPPVDLAGNTFTTTIGVGAHQAHLGAPSRLRGPIACATCHRVPTAIGDAGHLDSAAPAEVEAAIGWDRTNETCGSECHGPARPRWTQSGGVSCGSCHGIPPANHQPGLPLASCTTCHAGTVDAMGTIILTASPSGPTSKHMNGAVDVE